MAVVVTFLLTSALYGALAYLAWQRLAAHLKGNQEAVESFSRHVLIPIFGKSLDAKENGMNEEAVPDVPEKSHDK